jgi:hypothetical protein
VAGDRKPANPTNPGSGLSVVAAAGSPLAYDFCGLDAAVKDAAARNLQVMFVVFRAPDWAEGKDRPSGDAVPPGTWKPNPRAFGRFAQALGKRYTGHYNGLPRVHYFEVWTRRLGAGSSTRSASGGGASPAPISATPRTSCQASACRPRLLVHGMRRT